MALPSLGVRFLAGGQKVYGCHDSSRGTRRDRNFGDRGSRQVSYTPCGPEE